MNRAMLLVAAAACSLAMPVPVMAKGSPYLSIQGLRGEVEIQAGKGGNWFQATRYKQLNAGNCLRTGADGYADLADFEDRVIELRPNELLCLRPLSKSESWADWFRSLTPRPRPNPNAGGGTRAMNPKAGGGSASEETSTKPGQEAGVTKTSDSNLARCLKGCSNDKKVCKNNGYSTQHCLSVYLCCFGCCMGTVSESCAEIGVSICP